MQYIAAFGWCIVTALLLVATANRGIVGFVVGAVGSAPMFLMASDLAVGELIYLLAVPGWVVAFALCNWLAVGRTPASVSEARSQFAYRSRARTGVRRRVMVQTTEGIK